MRTIKASEIGTYLFCQRAWWYQNQGIVSENISELTLGKQIHYQHSRKVLAVNFMRFIAYGLILVSLLLTVVHLTNQFL